MSSPTSILIPIDKPHNLTGAARIFAVLAYPSNTDQTKRESFVSAVNSWLEKRYRAVIGGQSGFLPHPRDRNDSIGRKLGLAAKRVNRRFVAAEIAIQLLMERHGNGTIRLRPAPTRTAFGWENLNLVIEPKASGVAKPIDVQTVLREFFSREVELAGSDLSNYRRIYWKESLSVLNVALAVKDVGTSMLIANPEWRSRPCLEYMISNPNWLPEALFMADQWQTLLPRLLPECAGVQLLRLEPWRQKAA